MQYFIGLDVGTTGAKAVLIDAAGTVRSVAGSGYPLQTPRPLWSEQNPADWWRATAEAVRQAVGSAGITAAQVAGIGLTGQMHGLVLLDDRHRVLRPCILWNDQRTGPQCRNITSTLGAERLLELTGNPVLPGFTAPKLVWVRDHEPAIFDAVARVLLPKDYIRYRMTGEFASDVSDASGTSLFDVRRRAWSAELLQALEIPREWLPEVVESLTPTGTLTGTAAAHLGLQAGIPVVAGAGDQAAGAVGSGTVTSGRVSAVLGTSGVVFAHADRYVREPQGRLHAFCHALPGAWHLMGVTLSAAGSLRWLRDLLTGSGSAGQEGSYARLTAGAEGIPAGSEGLLFLPYLSGERTPYPDPEARGAFIGLTLRHDREHLVRAVMEGVAFSLRDCLELVRGLEVTVDQIRVTGGGARSPLWCRILADVFQTEIRVPAATEGAPFGAALLAAVAGGAFNSVPEACRQAVSVQSGFEPDPETSARYDDYYSKYHELYEILRPTFSTLTGLVDGAPATSQ